MDESSASSDQTRKPPHTRAGVFLYPNSHRQGLAPGKACAQALPVQTRKSVNAQDFRTGYLQINTNTN